MHGANRDQTLQKYITHACVETPRGLRSLETSAVDRVLCRPARRTCVLDVSHAVIDPRPDPTEKTPAKPPDASLPSASHEQQVRHASRPRSPSPRAPQRSAPSASPRALRPPVAPPAASAAEQTPTYTRTWRGPTSTPLEQPAAAARSELQRRDAEPDPMPVGDTSDVPPRRTAAQP